MKGKIDRRARLHPTADEAETALGRLSRPEGVEVRPHMATGLFFLIRLKEPSAWFYVQDKVLCRDGCWRHVGNADWPRTPEEAA